MRTFSIRPYIGMDNLHIDGRMIPYPLVNCCDYIMAKNPEMTDEEYEDYAESHYDQVQMLNAIIAMKQSCVLLRHTAYSCGSLSDSLFRHKNEMVVKYNELYPDEPFDESFYEHYRDHISVEYLHLKDIDISGMRTPVAVVYDKPMDFPDKFVVRIMDMFDGGLGVSNAIIKRDSIMECREELYAAGFCTSLPRCIYDDACIVETWMRTGV